MLQVCVKRPLVSIFFFRYDVDVHQSCRENILRCNEYAIYSLCRSDEKEVCIHTFRWWHNENEIHYTIRESWYCDNSMTS